MKRIAPSAGFTIIELLVATAVFALVLVVVTTGILQVSRVYYKGLTEANTQDTARNIMDTIAQAIQFSGGDVTTTPGTTTSGMVAGSTTPGTSYAFCIGNRQFSYTLGYQVMTDPDPGQYETYHALVANDNVAGCSGSTPAQEVRGQTVTGRDLVAPRMRLANLAVTNVGTNLYRVQVKVVYGDDDLLNNPTSSSAVCQSVRAGTQFCAVSDLSTIVVKRVE